MKIIIMHQTVTNHDAIGNDIEAIYSLLKNEYDCYVYAENQLNNNVAYISEKDAVSTIQEKDSVILYHHSVYWEKGYEFLKKSKGKIIFRYHNITPEKFFEPYNDFYFNLCKMGREQTNTLMDEFPGRYWMADSIYNAHDLTKVDKNHILISAPFHKTEEWIQVQTDEVILKSLIESKEINLLFVGRVAPNKGHMMLLDIVRVYNSNYEKPVKLRIVGKFDEGLPKYNNLIKSTIEKYGIEDAVEFIGEINDSILASYYLGSDFYICASEHEGFCVPVIESQMLGLPIIALDMCAVPETMGNKQMLFDKDVKKFAAAIHQIYENEEYYDYLIKNGYKNAMDRFSNESIEKVFMNAFKEGLEG